VWKVGTAGGGNGKEEAAIVVAVGKPLDISVDIELAADWVPTAVLKQSNFHSRVLLRSLQERRSSNSRQCTGRDYVWCGQIDSKGFPSEEKMHGHHGAHIFFLNEGGDYRVSACVSFSRTDNDDDVKEIYGGPRKHKISTFRTCR
jgi:hypothetical protein